METRIFWYISGALIAGILIGLAAGSSFGLSKNKGTDHDSVMSAETDRYFIEQMIPHHDGAIAMAQIALERTRRPEIKSLAQGIIEAQTHENDRMRQWYQQWFSGTPDIHDTTTRHMDGTEGDLEALRSAQDIDQEFIIQMIPHHEMAIMMAQMLIAGTQRQEMRGLADQIITSQSREIDMMRSWSQAWSSQ